MLVLSTPRPSMAVEAQTPAWLQANVGTGDGQIAPVVLERARALYLKKKADGTVKNPCYFAMDATKAADMGGGHRFYVICEAAQTFRALAVGHGSGRNLKGVKNFSNGRSCVKNFGNALDSNLTMGGSYITRETKTSFKGYYRSSLKQLTAFQRTFIQFDGEGEAALSRKREIGGHPSALLRAVCMRKMPDSHFADKDGMVPFGKLIDYSGGRSNGCTSWTPSDAREIIPKLKGDPATLYIYPESKDIEAVNKKEAGAYWNAACLKQIGAPKFWSNSVLGPIIAQYEADNPVKPAGPLPVCKGP
nr:hypothetical protein [Aestuariivirga litoralis]